ncbi:SMC family ATPase [Cellulomonas sp. P24]|uniref:AAA family ATPase n=1 Tax=Cellulomonas sp. P24 TaxID=2885206 RepID=UPI00216B0F47|nr:SMC family ATPase [Cellulomonas sp. P24]MCR6492948.1 SMC family ATPase [Cellulomonas sp. P24]
MHLHSMTLQAIGPFAGRHTIDFEALGASGIFLLEGPTGAGKSTLIDAIVFALYGKVASAEASEDRLRSGHAADGVESVVDLVLETGNGIYRVRRTPQYDRPKKRGEGTVRQQATVKLWRLTSLPDGPVDDLDELDGDIVSTRLDEAGLELRRAIGLDREQFVQTIVLPQGEFASFLRADPEARSGLLQKIFGTQAYEQLQRQLEEMRREVGRAVAEARADVGRAAAHFIGAASLTDDDPVGDVEGGDDAVGDVEGDDVVAGDERGDAESDVVASDVAVPRAIAPDAGGPEERTGPASEIRSAAEGVAADLVDLVDAQVVRLRQATERASADAARARAEHLTAREALDAATAQASAVARRDALRSEQAALDARSADHATRRARLGEARRAAVVRPLLDGADRAEAVWSTAAESWRAAVAAAPAELVALLSDLDVDALDASRARDREVVATLERVVAIEDGLPALRASREQLAAELVRIDDDLVAVEQDLLARPEERRRIVAQQAGAATLAGQVGSRQERARAVRAVLTHAQDAERTRTELATASDRHRAAVETARAALRAETHLRAARIEGMAGELAAALRTGEPCPVCGAVEHPAPAQVGADHPDPQEIEDAAQARAVADGELARLAAATAALAERLTAHLAATGGLEVAEAESQLAEAEAGVTEAEAAQEDVARLQRELDEHDAATEAARAQADTLRTTRASSSRLTALDATLADHEREIATARGAASSVRERRAALKERIAGADRLVTASRAVQEAERARELRRLELDDGLRAHGFAEVAEARGALVEPAALAALEDAVTAHEAAVVRVTAGLRAPELADLPEVVELDLAGVRVRAEVAERRSDAAASALAVAGRRAADAYAASVEVAATVARHAAAARDAAPVIRMANLATGAGSDNARALSLATFVLVRRFEDVVAAANERLLLMSDGRFELVRSDEREDTRARRTGLAMKVVDHRIEAARDPRTLSGGETFYVSLCLALGMADVVTAEAGGIDLGTLFVDEGFGSLDPHTLDAVLAELGKLRAGGRVVGVVSHVEAMKQQLADRIEVRRLPDGSSTLTVRAG